MTQTCHTKKEKQGPNQAGLNKTPPKPQSSQYKDAATHQSCTSKNQLTKKEEQERCRERNRPKTPSKPKSRSNKKRNKSQSDSTKEYISAVEKPVTTRTKKKEAKSTKGLARFVKGSTRVPPKGSTVHCCTIREKPMCTNGQIPFKHWMAEGKEMQPQKTTALVEIKGLEIIE